MVRVPPGGDWASDSHHPCDLRDSNSPRRCSTSRDVTVYGLRLVAFPQPYERWHQRSYGCPLFCPRKGEASSWAHVKKPWHSWFRWVPIKNATRPSTPTMPRRPEPIPGGLTVLNWTASRLAAATTATSPLNLPKAAQTGGYLAISQGGWWLSSREGAQRKVERHRGIEPLSSAWKAEVLPLDE